MASLMMPSPTLREEYSPANRVIPGMFLLMTDLRSNLISSLLTPQSQELEPALQEGLPIHGQTFPAKQVDERISGDADQHRDCRRGVQIGDQAPGGGGSDQRGDSGLEDVLQLFGVAIAQKGLRIVHVGQAGERCRYDLPDENRDHSEGRRGRQ